MAPLRGNFTRDRREGAVFGRAVKSCPPDRLPLEGETIFARVTVRSLSDYVIDQETGCWVWTKGLLDGYPIGSWGRMHRAYYMRAHGLEKLHPKSDVHHTCENKACINPAHLELKSSTWHRREHKLKLKGKLTWDQAREIRRRCQEDHTLVYHVLATEYGCSRGHIQDIVEGIAFYEPGVQWIKPDRDCAHCGSKVPFEQPRHAIYCSRDCRIRAASKRRWAKKKAAKA